MRVEPAPFASTCGNGMVGVGLITSGFRVWQSFHVAVLFRFRSFSAFTMLG